MATMVPRRVLIVEDDPAIRELVRLHLTLGGHTVEESANGRHALSLANDTRFDLILLDLMLPDLDGITVCRAVRAGGLNGSAPILMLTARDSESDKVLGLESGADDYLTKPFGVRELMARVAALLRRQTPQPLPDKTQSGPFTARGIRIDRDRRTAVVREAPVDLTRQEFDLLALLASQPGIVFSRAALLTRVWSGDTYVTERTVDSVVSRLRKKVEIDADDPELILTAWGVGYKFADTD
jgi:two-component system, OmpR family, alkaline phosphatase synthesis response regulator PhoP